MHFVTQPLFARNRKLAVARLSGVGALCLFSSGFLTTRSAIADAAISMAPPVSAASVLPQPTPLISLEFESASVSEILTMIGKEGNIDIIINDDVTATLKRVRLTDKTPDQAIRIIAKAAHLSWEKSDAKTYIISKVATSSTGIAGPEGLSPASSDLPNGVDPSASLFTMPAPLAPTKAAEDAQTTASIEVRNVKPRIMAFWLDPGHQPIPEEFVKSDNLTRADVNDLTKPRLVTAVPNNSGGSSMNMPQTQPGSGYLPFNPYTNAHPQFGSVGGTNGGTNGSNGNNSGTTQEIAPSASQTIALPQGVDNLIAVDSQNILLVRGTDEGIERIRELIRILDKPIPQVEIEAQFVTVSATDLNQFGLNFTSVGQDGGVGGGAGQGGTTTVVAAPAGDPTAANGGINVSYVRGSFQAALQAQVTKGRARVVQAPRITTFNNLAAQVSSSFSTTVPITTQTIQPGNNGGPQLILTTTNYFSISSTTRLLVVPTINRDGTITITLEPFVSSFQNPTNGSPFPDLFSQTLRTSANIKDGDTLAIGGLRTQDVINNNGGIPFLKDIPLIGQIFRSKRKRLVDSELIVFLTAHVVRRIDDPVAGT